MKICSRLWNVFTFFLFIWLCILSCCSSVNERRGEVLAISSGGKYDIFEKSLDDIEGVQAYLEPVYFDFNSAYVKKKERKKIALHSKWLKNRPHISIQIEGYCDEIGSEVYNYDLGERRAMAVKKIFIENGIEEKRLYVVTQGRLAGNSDLVRSKNRRASFVAFYAQ